MTGCTSWSVCMKPNYQGHCHCLEPDAKCSPGFYKNLEGLYVSSAKKGCDRNLQAMELALLTKNVTQS